MLPVDVTDAPARWAASGGMALTGEAGLPPLAPPAPVANALDATGFPDAAALVGERGLARRGSISCSGASHLVRAADGWVVITLSRPTDWQAVPAWLGVDPTWSAVTDTVAGASAADVAEAAQLLELPVAVVGSIAAELPPPRLVASSPPISSPPLVVDLSALWAGPLCGDLLERAGATVIKVEDPGRPDGARFGDPRLFALLNGAKRNLSIALSSPDFASLLRRADVVITSGRQRAFDQLGINPLEVLAESPTVWVAVTAYGWASDDRNRVGFGDDVAAGCGLVTWSHDRPGFVADAVADPLTGALAARTALTCLAQGGSWFIDAPLAGAASWVAALARGSTIQASSLSEFRPGIPVAAPRARAPRLPSG